MNKKVDVGVIIAVAWLATALWVTLFLGPRLGLRGWLLLGIHHVICIPGCTHELWRGWKRRKKRLAGG